MPDDIVEAEEAGTRMLQLPEEEQQLLATSAPSGEEIQGATSTAGEAESEMSTPFSPLPDQGDEEEEEEDDDEEEGEESPADGEDKEMIPDEAFLPEGANRTLVCSISFKLMTSAVVAMDTHSYQKAVQIQGAAAHEPADKCADGTANDGQPGIARPCG